MPTFKRFAAPIVLLFTLAAGTGFPAAARAQDAGAPATARHLCDALLTAMKKGPALGFAGRRDLLAPEIRQDLDLPFMTRLAVGPPWQNLSADERSQLVEAFSSYSIATYAQRFKAYSGERFEVDPSPNTLPRGDCIVHTRLFTGDPQPVQLDYLMRESGGRWRIIDVYLSGTISEMAARRSEYSTVLRQGGAPALIALLNRKSADYGN